MKNHNTKLKGEAIYVIACLFLVIGYSCFCACGNGGISPEQTEDTTVFVDSVRSGAIIVDTIKADTLKVDSLK
jgi:hypothetical protein